MKNQLVILAFIGTLTLSCENTNPSFISEEFYDQAAVIEDYPYITPGEAVVFSRYYQAEDIEEIADDEYSEHILFSIPADLTEFEFKNKELNDLNLQFYPHCFCIPTEGVMIDGGIITGKKVANRWQIDANFDVRSVYYFSEDSTYLGDPINKRFSGSFKKSEIE